MTVTVLVQASFNIARYGPVHAAKVALQSIWLHPEQRMLELPLYASAISVLVLIVSGLNNARKIRQNANKSPSYFSADPPSKSLGHHLNKDKIVAFKIARVLAFVALTGLSIYTAQINGDVWLRSGIVQTYTYLSILSFISITDTSPLFFTAGSHITLISLLVWCIFAYRDLWPLGTYTLQPVDAAEGWFIWTKIGILTVAAIFVPLVMPRRYVPPDPQNPEEVNPEQTASILSAALYSWLSPYIWLGNRVEHLALEQLPPLADYDRSENLVKRGMKHIDPFMTSKKGSLFFGLIRVFWEDISVISAMLLIQVLSTMALPIGIYHLLNYLSGDRTDIVRPWVWILWMAVGPIMGSIAVQWYRFVTSRMGVHIQALVTQVIFNHALRIRVKSDSSDKNANSKSRRPGSNGNLAGKLNNLVTTDLLSLVEGRELLQLVLYLPLQLALCAWFLYSILGWSAFMGMSVIFVTLPLPTWMARHIQSAQKEKMRKTDSRVQLVTEIMNVIRMIKLFAWERKMHDRLAEKREEELQYLKKTKFLQLAYKNINFAIPLVTMIVTFATYTLVSKQQLTASRVFSSMSVFEVLQEKLQMTFGLVPTMIRAKVSLDRINEFLVHTELLDQYTEEAKKASDNSEPTTITLNSAGIDPSVIGISQADFTWNSEASISPTLDQSGSNQRNLALRITDNVQFKRGCINLIVGPTGCGKTSLLMALLGEMHYIGTGPGSYVQLPREGGLAYAAQESWVLNATIRDNILFGAPLDEARYNQVLDQCGLRRDLSLFKAGDSTEVGEKGITLSGGQKARITLARAVYSTAEILLLDDVLAALDVHTSKWIVEKCFKGDLLKGRTILLATHNVLLVRPIAEFVVSLGADGRIVTQGSPSDGDEISVETQEEQNAMETATTKESSDPIEPINAVEVPKLETPRTSNTSSIGKLIVAEEISRGRVGWSPMKLYLTSMGGDSPFLFWLTFLGGVSLQQFVQSIQAWYLGYWAEQYERHDPSKVQPLMYLTGYSLLLTSGVAVSVAAYVVFVYGCLRVSRTIHDNLIQSVLGTTMRWLDTTPTSRIIARCTQDISAVDGPITALFTRLIELTISMFIKFTAVVIISPMFLIPGVVISILGAWVGRIYLKPQLSARRETSNARAPVLSHFSAAFSGLASIRAYGAQGAFKLESYARVDRYTRAARTSLNINRWMSLRVEILAGLFAAGLAAYLVYSGGTSSADTGFSLTMAVGFNGLILWWVRMWNEFEASANSLERVEQYLTIEQEPKTTNNGVPPAHWPSSGDLVVENLSARYFADGPNVLHNISFKVSSGERIGIVGRTGSGKSSLTLALLRCIFTEGRVIYDGIPLDSINLDALRSNITIIPQAPELLAGTLRENLDPFAQHTDAALNDALRASGLFSTQSTGQIGQITLDTHISSGGSNVSTGQRQIIALARAIVRQSKLLILDEATSAIDYETDSVIQASLRQQIGKDVTVLTVAHRLQSVMDADAIMVLDAGSIVEYGRPAELLNQKVGIFRALVDESRDRAKLYALLGVDRKLPM
ncbi:hypothetical protein BC835DRAFT_1360883 [Cytidiella melzeri]|nr:hypothetical protein BC835DRAFT_1360883 [Cytidiella melzeri]